MRAACGVGLEKKAEKAIEAPDWVTLGKGPVTHVRLEKKKIHNFVSAFGNLVVSVCRHSKPSCVYLCVSLS